jgi:CRISPR type IV-associated protein Csf1
MMVPVSQLACEALGVAPLDKGDLNDSKKVRIIEAPSACHCSLCGKEVVQGEVGLFDPLKGLDNFMDDFSLAAPGNKWACRYCAPLLKQAPMNALKNTVITREGVFPAWKNIHIKYWLQNLPEPPWVWLAGKTKKAEHLVWKATATIDNEIIQVLYGDETMVIRPKHLARLFEINQILVKRLNTEGKKKAHDVLHIFNYLGHAINEPKDGLGSQFGILRASVLGLDGVDSLINEIYTFTRGEIWALGFLVRNEDSVKPEKITLS